MANPRVHSWTREKDYPDAEGLHDATLMGALPTRRPFARTEHSRTTSAIIARLMSAVGGLLGLAFATIVAAASCRATRLCAKYEYHRGLFAGAPAAKRMSAALGRARECVHDVPARLRIRGSGDGGKWCGYQQHEAEETRRRGRRDGDAGASDAVSVIVSASSDLDSLDDKLSSSPVHTHIFLSLECIHLLTTSPHAPLPLSELRAASTGLAAPILLG
ncbi:hypothetical protein K438DRAFT_2022127 [Mycena galopus ATCC 62051]|nr:hypothetical protein K438DRAFT_2022127 [Mycena galopus ATCC 62051]